MANQVVERAYTYVGAKTPTLFYYHQTCWAKAAPKSLTEIEEGKEYQAARGTIRLVAVPGTTRRCQQCERELTA